VVLTEQFRSFLGGSGRRKWTDGSAVGARDRDGDNAGATIAQSHSSHVPARDRDGDASPTGTRKGGPPGSTPVDAPLDWAPESLPRRGALRFCFQKSRHAFWRDEHLISEKYINFEIGSREGDQSKKGAFLASTIAHPPVTLAARNRTSTNGPRRGQGAARRHRRRNPHHGVRCGKAWPPAHLAAAAPLSPVANGDLPRAPRRPAWPTYAIQTAGDAVQRTAQLRRPAGNSWV
jgi:hypothetical protein